MFEMFKQFDRRPDHPMSDEREAARLLAELSQDDALHALEEVSAWLASVKDTAGFRCDTRVAVVKLLDDAGRPHQAELLGNYLRPPMGTQVRAAKAWQALRDFWSGLFEAYGTCVSDFERGEKAASQIKGELPLLTARALRAGAHYLKLRYLRYLPQEGEVWGALYRRYSYAEINGFHDQWLPVYPNETVKNSVQSELLKAMMLDSSAPETLTPEQLEIAFRTVARFGSQFVWSRLPVEGCTFSVNLSRPRPPISFTGNETMAASRRFFGGMPALPLLEEMVKQNERGIVDTEQRLGDDFTSTQKVTVLRHLIAYWGNNPPRRRHERTEVMARVEIVHDIKQIARRITNIDAAGTADVTENLELKVEGESGGLALVQDEHEPDAEVWTQKDNSDWGLGAEIPAGMGRWTKAGLAIALRVQDSDDWWVGVVRRLKSDPGGLAQCGIQILSKKPIAVWLRVLGQQAHKASAWESSTGSFAYDYEHVILLPDAPRANDRPVMLMARHGYYPNQLFEVMVGERVRWLKLVEFIEQGQDYVKASFDWQAPQK